MDVICFSDITWNFLWQRQQQMISRFPNDWNIFFVEPSFWLSVIWGIIKNNIFHFIPHKVKDNIQVTSIITIPFGDKFKSVRKINDSILERGIKKLSEKHMMKDPILLFYKPRYSCVIEKFTSSLVCYDIIDDTLALESSPDWLKEKIQVLESKSDLIITSSENLFQKISKKRDNVFYIGNGVDVEHFIGSNNKTKNSNKFQKLVIGYIGAIGEWFDFELLEKILRKFPNCEIILIGWTFRNQKNILNNLKNKYKNLQVLGLKPYNELPKFLKEFDVCIIPFKIYQLTNSVNPIKVYEYFAAQKPVVITALPELRKFKDVLYFSNNHEEFLENTQKALTEQHSSEKSLKIAKENDWNSKSAEMIKLIQEYGMKKSC